MGYTLGMALNVFVVALYTKQVIFCIFQVDDGIQGILRAYSSAIHNVSFAGPTLFGPIINTASEIASQALANSLHKYFVLLIITVRKVVGNFCRIS